MSIFKGQFISLALSFAVGRLCPRACPWELRSRLPSILAALPAPVLGVFDWISVWQQPLHSLLALHPITICSAQSAPSFTQP